MRLHRLRLRAVGPFAGEQSIDFDPLGVGGLFLLDGPTGAGKSTVLDAITFALYGAGEGGGWGRLHSHFAAAGVEPQVQLEFSLRGVRQRVTRSPDYPRPKRRGAGTVRERARVHLERWEGERWVSRSARPDEVGELIGDDLGLTREQFTQVVLLPQGEFMRFLRANDDERRALLTQLFGTQLYDRITDELDRRRALATRDMEAADARLRLRIGAAAEAAGLGRDEQDELAGLAGLDGGPRDQRLDELGRQLAATAAAAAAASDSAAVALGEWRGSAEHADVLAERMLRLIAATGSLARHELTRPDFEQAAVVLAAAERAEPVRPLVEACVEAETRVADALAQLLRLCPDAESAWRRGEGRTELQLSGAEASRLAAELTRVVASERQAADLQAALVRARTECDRAAADFERLTARHSALPDAVAAAERAVCDARDQAATHDGLRQRHEAVAARLAAVRRLAQLAPEREAAQARRETAFAHYARAVTRHLDLVEARLANMAAELSAALVDGEPCAVCGALEHPAPARRSPDAASADEVGAAQVARAAAEHERDVAVGELADLDERRAGLLAAVTLGGHDSADPVALSAELADLDARIDAAQRSASTIDALSQTQAALEVERAALGEARQRAAAALAAAASGATSAERAVGDLAVELTEAAAGHSSVADRQRALLAQAARFALLADAVAAVADSIALREAALARAAREATSTGFATLDVARAAILPRAELAKLRLDVAQWTSTASRLHGALDADEFAGLDVADAPAVELAAAAARQAMAAAEGSARRLGVIADRASTAVERFGAARTDLDVARREHDEIDRVTAPVVHLARLAKGVAGQRRVALTTYVLRQWFAQVIAAANVRLSGMSSGRYELVRVDEGVSRAERAGLTLQVLDRHTGEQRSARSLSGGETFYTSLALALGLADVVRAEAGGVDLDTLFIDEGFGSLDADTLDQVMAVIDELRGRGRTVGIVSHVSELKDRIAERIEVRRIADGSSSLHVVA